MADPLITIPFTGGPQEDVDPRLVPAGTVVTATNQVYDQDGAYRVRYGLTMLGSTFPSSILRLAVFFFELLAIDALGGCWSYSPSDAAFIQKDTLPAVQVTHQPLFNATQSFASWGAAVANGYRVIGWVDSSDSTPHAAVYDVATGAQVAITKLQNATSTNVFVGVVGSEFVMTVAGSGSAIIRAFTTPTTGPGTWTGTIITTTGYTSTTGVYAADFTPTAIYLAYEVSGSPSSVRVLNVTTSFVITTATQALTTGTSGFTTMAMRATDGERVWVAINTTSTGYATNLLLTQWLSGAPATFGTVQAVTPNTVITTTHVTRLAIERVSSTQCVLVADQQQIGISYAQFTASGQVGNAMGVLAVGIASAPVALNGTAYMYLFSPYLTSGQQQGTYYLVDLLLGTTATTVVPLIQSVLAPGIVNLAKDNVSTPQVNVPRLVLNGSSYETVMPIVRGAQGRQGLELFAMATQSYSRAWAGGVTLGRELYVGGEYYDGNRAAELGFGMPPPAPALSNNSGTGSTYDYCMTWGRVDAQGNLEESAPSPVTSIASGAPPNVTVTASAIWLTNKQRLSDATTATAGPASFVYAILYRTQVTSSGDTTFYRLTKEPLPVALQNSQSAVSMAFTDTLSDASLTDGTHPVLYTTSGELVHNAPETFIAATMHKQRIWGIGADQATIWFSQTYSAGQMPAWNPSFTLTVDDAGEPLTCIASMYDKLVVFTRNKIFIIYGDGPSVAGTGSDLTAPVRVPSMSGCIDPRSVVNTPLGIMFQSSRGIELLTPQLDVSFIGLAVSTTTATYPTCTSAVHAVSSSTVRFTFVNSESFAPASGSGVVVLYDLRRQRWAVHSITKFTTGGPPPFGVLAPLEASTYHPTYGWVGGANDPSTTACAIYREAVASDPYPWTDFGVVGTPGQFVPLTVTTAWVKNGDPQGWMSVRRVRALMQYFDVHTLTIGIQYNYESTIESHSWSDLTIQTIQVSGREQVRAVTDGSKRRCEALQVTLSTSKPTIGSIATGQGAAFTGISLEVMPKKGGFRRYTLPQGQT